MNSIFNFAYRKSNGRKMLRFSTSFAIVILFLTGIGTESKMCHGQNKDQKAAKKDPLMGRRVMTVEWGAEFKLGKDVVGIVELGKVFTVDGAKGNWYHFRGKHGWMKDEFFLPLEQAVSHFTKEINESPEAKNYHHRGIAWRERGEFAKAIKDIETAIEINGEEPSYYNSLGTVYHRQKDFKKAREYYNKALKMSPNNIGFMNNRGIASRELGQFDEALKDFDEAIKLAPNYAYAYGSKAWLFATANDKSQWDAEKAVSLAKTACELTKWKEDDLLGTLAAAYARAGDFEQAQRWLKSAITINPDKYPELRQAMKRSFDQKMAFTR